MSQETMVMPSIGNTQRQSNPFWYRENSSFLYGVTNAPNNPMLGIENISLKDSSANQKPYGILANGILSSVVGTISFQLRVSKSGAPFIQTISTKLEGQGEDGKDRYWEHIMLKPQVRAQILRFYEALVMGVAPQPAPMQQGFSAPAYGAQQGFAPQQQFGMPMQQQGFGMPPQQQGFGMPAQPQGFGAPAGGAQYPNYGTPATPPPAESLNASANTAPPEASDISDDDLPC